MARAAVRAWIDKWFGSPWLIPIVLFVCVAVPMFVIWRTADLNPKLSALDEGTHLDYTTRLSRFELPRLGDRATQQNLRLTACKGLDLQGVQLPPCHRRVLRPDDFPGGGYQYEAHQPPAYYGVTAVLRFFTQRVFGISDYLEASRATGVIWLAAGLLLLWLAGRLFEVNPWAVAAVILFIALAPVVVYLSSIVTNDTASIFAGGFALCLAGFARRRQARWVPGLMFAGGAFVALFKSTDVIALGAVGLLLLWEALTQRPEGAPWRDAVRPWLRTGGMLLLGGAMSLIAWSGYTRLAATVDPRTIPIYVLLHVNRFNWEAIWSETSLIFGPMHDTYSPPFLNTSLQSPFIQLGKALLLAGGFCGLFVRPRRWPHVLGFATLVSMVLGAFALGVLFYLSYRADAGISGRYGLSAAPVLGLCLAGAVKGRGPIVALSVFSAWYFAFETWALLR